MKPDLDALRQQQQSLLGQMQAIDRLRRGSLSCQFFPATKPRAARRGPYFLLQGSVDGKKFSERIPQDQAPQVQQDVDHYRRFQELTQEYVTVTDHLTRAQDAHPDSKINCRPPEVADAQFRETNAFLNLVRQALARQGVGPLEAVALGWREALFKDARARLQTRYRQPNLALPDHASRPGEKAHPDRPKTVQTLFGPIELRRTYFYHAATHTGRVPLDAALGLTGSFSPALVRLSARAAAKEGYASASEDLLAQAGVVLDGRQIQRLVNLAAPAVVAQLAAGPPARPKPIPVLYVEVDGTGVPMVAEELAGRAGQQADGSARTREVKLGAIFTQTQTDAEGRPVRDHAATT